MGEAIRITRSVWSARSLLPLLELFVTIERLNAFGRTGSGRKRQQAARTPNASREPALHGKGMTRAHVAGCARFSMTK